jgi:hypothetical protein
VDGKRKKVDLLTGACTALRQIYSDYHLPVLPGNLTLNEIHFWYDALIPGLIEIQKSTKEAKKNHGK